MKNKLNKPLLQIQESATVALADRVRKMVASGTPVIALQTGDPDFPTPAPIVEAAYKAIKEGLTHYSNSRGLPELRRAIAEKMLRENGGIYNPDTEILVTNGGVHAYFCALLAIMNRGDEVLVPDPSWMTHTNAIKALGGRLKRVPCSIENDFWPTLDNWEKAITKKTVAIVINSPNNPTGTIASKEYLQSVYDIAERNNLYIISDEVYEKIVYDNREHISMSSLPDAKQRILLINSFSKTYAMTGWRIGYLAAPTHIISSSLKAVQNSITNVAPFIQRAALCAITDKDVQGDVSKMVAVYQKRRNMAVSLLVNHEIVNTTTPKGAFYLFLDMRRLQYSSVHISEALLRDVSVAVVPGSAFGECGEGFIRITTAVSEDSIEKGLSKILVWAESNSGAN